MGSLEFIGNGNSNKQGYGKIKILVHQKVLAWQRHAAATFRQLWAYYNCDTSTIRVRFERDTTSYEELCAFEQ